MESLFLILFTSPEVLDKKEQLMNFQEYAKNLKSTPLHIQLQGEIYPMLHGITVGTPVPSIKPCVDGCAIMAIKGSDRCAVYDDHPEGAGVWTLYHAAPGVIDKLIKDGKTIGEIENEIDSGGTTVHSNADALDWVRFGRLHPLGH